MKKQPLIADEFRNFKGNAVKISPFRVNITPRGIEKFNEADESITYKRGEALWYKAYSKAEPEILAFRGLAIWNYNEFLTDVNLEGIPYRVFYNPVSKKFLVNEIVSFDYDGKGMVLLKNSVNEGVSLKVTEMISKLPKSDWIHTLNRSRKNLIHKKQGHKAKNPPKMRVRKMKDNSIIRATLFCISKYDRNEIKEYRPYILRAYKIYKNGQTEATFLRGVYAKWATFRKEYGKLSKEIKEAKSSYKYAKEVLKIPRNTTKRKTCDNEK
jgi:hypothetical protein